MSITNLISQNIVLTASIIIFLFLLIRWYILPKLKSKQLISSDFDLDNLVPDKEQQKEESKSESQGI